VAVFRATRTLQGSARWQLAAEDNAVSRDAMLRNFACALGADFSAADAPAFARVLARSWADVIGIVEAAKEHYQRPRPFLTENGAICIEPSERFAQSGSYPSAHSASGWLHALLLTELDPAHAGAILERGRAYGESRVVCGVHYISDVEGGRAVATAILAALHGNAEFGADLEAARTELARLRDGDTASPVPATCAQEKANLKTPW
jgi:acid phosphatase (class A)